MRPAELEGSALETVLADWRESAQVLRRTGDTRTADLIDRVLADVTNAAEEYLTKLSEEDAMLRSGKTREWLRNHWPGWAAQGHAWKDRGRRTYRMLVVPRRPDIASARDEAKRTAHGEAA